MVTRKGIPMDEQSCRLVWLRPEAVDEYDRLHREAPPEIYQRLRQGGVSDYSIFRHGELLINVSRRAEGAVPPTIHADLHREWQASLAPLFARTVDDQGGHIRATRVFRLD